MESAKWCYDHNLTQQGITQLQEGITTYLLDQLNELYKDDFFNCYEKRPRTLVTAVLNIIDRCIPESKWIGEPTKEKDRVNQLINEPLLIALASIFSKITNSRNDIQHAGYIDNASSTTFKENLISYIKNVEEIIYAPQSHQPPQ